MWEAGGLAEFTEPPDSSQSVSLLIMLCLYALQCHPGRAVAGHTDGHNLTSAFFPDKTQEEGATGQQVIRCAIFLSFFLAETLTYFCWTPGWCGPQRKAGWNLISQQLAICGW